MHNYLNGYLKESFPKNGLQKLASFINIPRNILVEELIAFAKIYPSMIQTIPEKTKTIYNDNYLSDDDFYTAEDNKNQNNCSGCLNCCFKLLYKFNLHSVAYTNLFLAYEYIFNFIIYTSKL
jgi:hypothetical protein